MSVTEEILITDHGDEVLYGVVHKRPGVSVIPFDGEKYYLIRQYRYPVDFHGWEYPAGHVEENDIEGSARMELEEEGGLNAKELVKLGSFFEAPGHLDQEIHVFLATGLTQGKRNLEPAEKGTEVGKFTLEETGDLIKKGQIKDGLTIAAHMYYLLHRGQS